jgi:hypothetical protein
MVVGLVAVFAIFALAGCGANNAGGSNGGNSSSQTSSSTITNNSAASTNGPTTLDEFKSEIIAAGYTINSKTTFDGFTKNTDGLVSTMAYGVYANGVYAGIVYDSIADPETPWRVSAANPPYFTAGKQSTLISASAFAALKK